MEVLRPCNRSVKSRDTFIFFCYVTLNKLLNLSKVFNSKKGIIMTVVLLEEELMQAKVCGWH